MIPRSVLLLVQVFMHVFLASCLNQDSVSLQALKDSWQNTPPNWVGSDPCRKKWDGITCRDSRVISITLSSMDLGGELSGDIGQLSELQTLDLSYNKRLTGSLTPDIGNLKKLSNLILIGCGFNGPLPDTLGSLPELGYLRLDRNLLSGDVPSNINNLTSINQLFLSNNKLIGPLPNLTGMTILNYLDMSNNWFKVTEIPPWFSSLQSLTTLMMQDTGLTGEVPVYLFNIPQIETVVLKSNHLNGTLDFGATYSNHLELVDLSQNLISAFTERTRFSADLILMDNPICMESKATASYCDLPIASNSSYSTPPNKCVPSMCTSQQVSSPNCKCSYPYTGTLTFRAPSFSGLGNSTIFTSLQSSMMDSFELNQLPVDSVSLSNPTKNSDDYFVVSLEVFPLGDKRFNRSGISRVGFVLSNQTYKPPHYFGPYFFIGNNYYFFLEKDRKISRKNILTKVIVIPLAVGLAILLGVSMLIIKKMRKPKMKAQFTKDQIEQKDVINLPMFSLSELVIATDNFSINNKLGEGGFGPVYKGFLEDGHEIAVKRLSITSSQGIDEFKNEVLFISKLQHRNLVRILGCCVEGHERMLIYEYMPNKGLDLFIFDETESKRLNWSQRFHIINGIARGLLYLHEDSRLRIIHRDLKAANILLDHDMNPKISDFGLARSFRGYETETNTKRVVGTYGYMSPEYAGDGMFSVKSDIFSFGVLVLEIVSGKKNRGFFHEDHNHNLLGHAWRLHTAGKTLELIDESMIDTEHRFQALRSIQVGLLCVQHNPADRPNMSMVVMMLSSDGQLPQPKQPGFYTEDDRFGPVNSSSIQPRHSNNGVTLTHLEPR